MAQLFSKIKKYLEANGKTYEEERKNIVLQNDGSGDYIHTWNVVNLKKPTEAKLKSYTNDAEKLERNNIVIGKRRTLYGSWDKQLEEINEQGLDAWKQRIAQIKADNPKED